MYAYQATRKKGRPALYGSVNSNLLLKKEELFENKNSKNIMDIINLAYNFQKITKEEKDIASFIQSLANKIEKSLDIKKIPSSAPHTWSTKIQNTYSELNQNYTSEIQLWNKIKIQLNLNNVPANFMPLITTHHSYEELSNLKNNFQLMCVLKKGLVVMTYFFNTL